MRKEPRNVWAAKSAAASGQCESISMYSAKTGICPLSLHVRKGTSSWGEGGEDEDDKHVHAMALLD